MKRNWVLILTVALVLGLWLSGCATTEIKKRPYRMSQQGTLIWDDEFEFKPPPSGWKIIEVEVGGEFGFGFMRADSGPFPSQSMFVYDEEPFGCSTQFENREAEFFKRYLWSAAVSMDMQILERQKAQVLGGEGLAVVAEGKDPVKKEKVKSKVVFGKRGIGWLPSTSPNGDLSTGCMILQPLKSLIDFGGLLDI